MANEPNLAATAPLKPCPFCGHPEPEFTGGWYECAECGSHTGSRPSSEEEWRARVSWNQRAGADELESLRAELERVRAENAELLQLKQQVEAMFTDGIEGRQILYSNLLRHYSDEGLRMMAWNCMSDEQRGAISGYADVKAELSAIYSTRCTITDIPAESLPTPEQVRAYLVAHGWRRESFDYGSAEPGLEKWEHQNGSTTFSAEDFDGGEDVAFVVSGIAAVEGRNAYAVLADMRKQEAVAGESEGKETD